MAEMGIHSVGIDRGNGEAEIKILMTEGIPGGQPLHRVSPDQIPDDIARALRRWLGYIDVPARTDRT